MAVRRVRRVIRKIDPWTVLKVSLVFNAIMGVVFVLGTVIFWAIFVNAGIPQRINELALLIGLESGINLEGSVYFRIVMLLAVIGTIVLTGFMTLGAVVYNLISDLVGGVEFIVLEESPSSQPARSKVAMPPVPQRSPSRRGILPSIKPSVTRIAPPTPRSGDGQNAEKESVAAEADTQEPAEETVTGEVQKTGS